MGREPNQPADLAAPDARGSAPSQEELDSFLDPQVPEGPPELVGGQPVSPLPPEPGRPSGAPPAPEAPVDDRLTKALQTIESLQREVADMRGRPPVVYEPRPAAREVAPEMIEVLPGRRIPKDPDLRPIKLRGEDLIRMGWNEDPAAALNALGNALLMHIADVIPQLTLSQLEETGRTYNAGVNRRDAFFNEFSDLKEFGDLADIVERQTMNEVPIQGMTQADWNREVGSRVRSRIAAMRGISMDQYMASLGGRPGGAPRPRAVTAPPSGGGRRSAPANDQQREIDDLIQDRLG